MVHHAIYYKQNYSYFGIIEALSGAPFDVFFISFDDILADSELLKKFDVESMQEMLIQPRVAVNTGVRKNYHSCKKICL